jgi:cytochrome c oxidase subunit 3
VAPAIQIGGIWPPKGIVVFNPWEIPLLNTVILLLSGVWATLGHNIIKFRQKKYYRVALIAFLVAIFLGILFTFVQFYEYATAPFSISDGIYGSTFFMTTGLHGVHVIVGTLFLIVITLRHHFKHFYHMEAVSVDAAVWYWHFVDVVWLFLFISIYWWGS